MGPIRIVDKIVYKIKRSDVQRIKDILQISDLILNLDVKIPFFFNKSCVSYDVQNGTRSSKSNGNDNEFKLFRYQHFDYIDEVYSKNLHQTTK